MAIIAKDEESPRLDGGAEGNYAPKRKLPYQHLKTELTLEDMANPGVQKLILAENSRLETENYEFKMVCDGYSVKSIEHASVSMELQQIKKANLYVDTLYSAGLGAGTALAGISISIQPFGVSVAVAFIGIAVAGIAILARVKRNEF